MTMIAVVNGGLRTPSSTQNLGRQLASGVREAIGHDVEVVEIDVRDHAHAIVDALLTGFPTDALAAALDQVRTADALVLVTPTFQASIAGLFKSFLDLVEEGTLRGTPVLLGATGGSTRHSLVIDTALRPIVAHLGAVSMPTGVFAATADFGASGLERRIARAADELATHLGGASLRRPKPDGFTDVTPFEQLLHGRG